MHATNRLGVFEKYGLWIAGAVILAGLHAITSYNYLVFHTIVEVFAIVVACGIFMLAWNSRELSPNSFLLFLGVAYLFVGVLDLIHALAYEGLGVFPGSGSDLATRLWIGARYLESLALLLAPVLAGRRLRAGVVFAGFLVVTTLVLLSNLHWDIFPVCFDPETGLTPFKKVSEYIISALLLIAVGLLWRRRGQFDRHVLRMLVASILLTVASELCFTLYRDAYDIANEVGHLLKLVSFYLIYRAVIQTGLRKPYAVLLRDLKRSNDVLEMRNRELQRFASFIRHDLGNPLFSVEAFAQCITNHCSRASGTIEDGDRTAAWEAQLLSVVRDEIPRSVDSIQSSVTMMKRLLEGLRQVAAVGYLPIHIDRVDMNGLLRQIRQTLKPRLAACGASLEVGDLPPCAGDIVQLNEVFSNLLDNAIKYRAPDRQGRIQVTGWSDDDTSVYCVEDNGIGIAPGQHARIFDIFHRVHPEGPTEGEGLGLSIVQRWVERHDGRVWLESEPGQGSRFFVSLPAFVSEDQRNPSHAFASDVGAAGTGSER